MLQAATTIERFRARLRNFVLLRSLSCSELVVGSAYQILVTKLDEITLHRCCSKLCSFVVKPQGSLFYSICNGLLPNGSALELKRKAEVSCVNGSRSNARRFSSSLPG